MQACNQRYLGCIRQWPDRTAERRELRTVTAAVRDEKDRSHRGVNFFHADDLRFLQAPPLPRTEVSRNVVSNTVVMGTRQFGAQRCNDLAP